VTDPEGSPAQYTPFKQEIDIASTYTVILVHPSAGRRELTIPGQDLRHGGSYTYAGSLAQPQSFVLRENR
jgi:hypothetical protein